MELAVESIVKETSEELCGDRHLENAMKKALAPNQSQKNETAAAALAAALVSGEASCSAKKSSGLGAATVKDNNNN